VTLTVGDWSETRSFQVMKDPRLESTLAELQENFELSVKVRDRITIIHRGVAQGQRVLADLEGAIARTTDSRNRQRAQQAKAELEEVLGKLYKHGQRGDHAHLYPRLTTDYARIYTMLASSDHRPPDSAYERFEELEPVFTELMEQLEAILGRSERIS
jgi:hypothetical protein